MISQKNLLAMIATEAVEGGPRDHYHDEARNREYIPPRPEQHASTETGLPPIQYDLQLVRQPDGSLEWDE